ncbi:hypothetical protein [Vreelandella utahensis]|uniref:hypothetical protein n=1 Tax=Vreelandella halophila TaxID=86177 RepID=UPI00098542CE|nr:hypothetical protein [Halomonas utahensis]
MNPATHDAAQPDLIGFTSIEAQNAEFLAREDVQKRLRSNKRHPDRLNLSVNGVRWRAVRGDWCLKSTREKGYPVVWWHLFQVEQPERGFFVTVSSAICADWLRQGFRNAIQERNQPGQPETVEKENQA